MNEININTKYEDVGVWGNFIKCMREYVNFKGRSDRYEYWSFLLCRDVILFIFGLISGFVGSSWIVTCAGLVMFLPFLGVLSRRMHDQDRNLWKYLLAPLLLFFCIILASFVGGMMLYIYGQVPAWLLTVRKLSVFLFALVFFVVCLIILYYVVRCGEMKDNKYGPQIPFDKRINEKGRMVMIVYFIYYLTIMFVGYYFTGVNV